MGMGLVRVNKAERLTAHQVQGTWVPNPEAHLQSPRDAYHFDWTLRQIGYERHGDNAGWSILDVGAYDGWLDFLLIKKGYKVEGVELIPELCQSAESYLPAKGSYRIHQGFFEDVEISSRFDVAICYELLEHIPISMVPVYVAKMEAIAGRILISLPDQSHKDNPQHLWTPTFDLIRSIWGWKPDFEMTYKPYPGTSIPPNFLCSWSVK